MDGSGRVLQQNLRLPGTRTPLPEVKIESDGRNLDTLQDHHEIRVNDELQGGGEEVQMEPVDPTLNPPVDHVIPIAPAVPVAPEDPVVRRSTRYPTTELDTT